MSRIDELISQFAPSGVRHVELHQVASYSDTRVDAKELDETNFVGVDNLLPDKGGKTDANYEPNTDRLTAYAPGDVLLGNIRPYLKKVWLATNSGGCSGDVLAIRIREDERPALIPKFLYYVLSSDTFFAYNMQNAKGAKMPRGSKSAILKYVVPIPPVEVQREIVRVLDSFSALEAELEAELEARRRQYAYYCHYLLTFPEDVPRVPLDKVCSRVTSGGTPSTLHPEYYGGDIPWVRTSEVDYKPIYATEITITEEGLRKSSAKWIPARSVIVAMIGATAGKAAFNEVDVTTNQNCCNLIVDPEKAHYKFVYYWLCREYATLRGLAPGAVPIINAGKIKQFHLPLPSLAEQQRVVDILDKLSAFVTDPSSGLPAELSARRTQYEYYRDKLLTFEEASV
ncbi:restriction endonuclease subunit S [Streptomyces albogriseolus]|uniref:restriction endonuclease subunit S n=1 Tax=Streptomyces albogriseolus TaxID=1887 RepID=UPI0036FBE2D4